MYSGRTLANLDFVASVPPSHRSGRPPLMSTVQRWQWLRNGPVWSGGNAVAMRLSLLVVLLLAVTGCATRQDHQTIVSTRSPINPTEFFQSHADRMATLGMRNNLNSLYRLMDKLYLRNPREWRKTGLPDVESAKRAVHRAIELDQPLPQLGGRTDVAALSYSLSAEYQGDGVGAFIYSLASMLITAHGGRTEYYLSDTLDPQFVHNAARNVEKASWMLALRTDVLDERYRRMGVSYAQGLLFMNFLPVQ